MKCKKGEKDGEEKAEDDKEQPQVANERKFKRPNNCCICRERTMEVVKIENEASQASADQAIVVSVKEQTTEVVRTEDEASQVINMYIKDLIQYFDIQYHARKAKEKIILADIFFCQYIGRAFNVWTSIISSPAGVELKKKLIWEKITSMQWGRTVSNCFNRGDLKVANLKLILIPWNLNNNHWVLCVVFFKGRKICIYNSLVDAKIANTQKKKKLSSGHQRIEDQLLKILPKTLICTDFANRSCPPTGSKVKNYCLNSK
ncbi:hypothetical protein GIB67_002641 [Kingdonia uniflora]|uniref:Ubiquitin-like protease family profile domain-containing protein n=1 Tax=Kingdonia uniflora TaxID=39325 RepID=A0A7J7N4U0_9MAGN|nr:hypothetical protein GIB67_002641 [Kingdonia uniflora]